VGAEYSTFYDIAVRLKDEAERRLRNTLGGVPSRSCVVPGAIAWDECECGQLSVSIIQAWPSVTFPGDPGSGSQNQGPCAVPYLMAQLTVQVARCAPNPDSSGSVACSALERGARVVAEDGMAIREAAFCALQFLKDRDDDFIVRGQVVMGPEGGCMGVEQSVVVGIMVGCQVTDCA
jgi:hypothetical protein